MSLWIYHSALYMVVFKNKILLTTLRCSWNSRMCKWTGRITLYYVYNHIYCDSMCWNEKYKKIDGCLTVCMCFPSMVSAHQRPQSDTLAQPKLSKPFACSGTSSKASVLLPTPIMLLQLSATVTKITKQRKPVPALSENSCNCSTNIYISLHCR